MRIAKEKIYPVIINALKEDMGPGDVTSTVIFEKDGSLLAHITAKEECVAAGMDIARWVFDAIDERIEAIVLCKDGDRIKKGKRLFSVKGSAKSILSAERTALNFLGHLSGIATLTSEYVDAVKNTGAKIYDTRKTVPGMRELEKYAVTIGGGHGYRMGLWDGVLIKDNHLSAAIQGSKVKTISFVAGLFKGKGYKNIEMEVENIAEFEATLEAGVDIIMLDNMKIEDMKKAVKLKEAKTDKYGTKIILEASGGISLDNVKDIAKTGVDRISIGKLTHSAPSIDFSLEI